MTPRPRTGPWWLGGTLVLAWVVSRSWVVWLLSGPHAWVAGDVAYFDQSLQSIPDHGLEDTLREYPLPAVAVVAAPWLLAQGAGLADHYGTVLMGVALLTDLAFTVLLAVLGRDVRAVAGWVLAVPLLGATTYARFDLLPGVLCGTAVLLLSRHPRAAAGAAAVATAVKLWPALLLPPLVAAVRRRAAAVGVVLGLGGALAVGALLLAGWGRLVSPLAYQAERGLQIESVAATPLMVAWWLGPGSWDVDYASSKAYEITGPGVGAALVVSTVLTIGYVVALGLAWWRVWRICRGGHRLPVPVAVWLMLASVTGFVVVGKVLSPQYLLWLLPIAVAGIAVTDDRRLVGWTAWLLLAAGLTQVVFPVNYGDITWRSDGVWLPVLALAGRNAVMVLLLAVAATRAWRALWSEGGVPGAESSQRGSALDRQPPGPEGNDVRTLR